MTPLGDDSNSTSQYKNTHGSTHTGVMLCHYSVISTVSRTFLLSHGVWQVYDMQLPDEFVISHSMGLCFVYFHKQGKSEGFESCDWPIVRKRPIWVKIGDVLHRVTLKFDGWPWKTIGHLSFAVSSCVQHFIAIGEFKLELQSGNTQFGSNSTIFRTVWPWNLTDDLEKQ